jgi:F-type H+-transporting ATPase subunit b
MLQSLHVQILSSGLIDLDGTFFLQLAIFMIFAFLLNVLLVKPLMKTQSSRHAHMAGAREEAERMNISAADDAETYDSRIAAARKEAMGVRDDIRDSATAEAQAQLGSVNDETQAQLVEGRAKIAAATAATQGDTDAAVEALATAIADRVLGEQA